MTLVADQKENSNINLRVIARRLTEDQWVSTVQTARARLPMLWYVLHVMDEQELRDMYAYIRSLPVAGEEAPAFVDPEQAPATPNFTLVVPEEYPSDGPFDVGPPQQTDVLSCTPDRFRRASPDRVNLY